MRHGTKPRSILVAIALLAAACSTAEPALEPATTTTVAATATTAATTTTTQPMAEDDRTARPIGPETLGLMLPAELPEPWTSFSRQSALPIDNQRAITLASQDLADETADIDRHGRVDGVRAVYVPRFGGGAVLTIESWIDLFETDAGASGYLIDSVGDAAKRIDGGRSGSYVIDLAEDFAIDDVGTETVAVTISERTETGAAVTETLVGFRIGRLLGYVSIARADDGDVRIAAQRLAETLRDSMLGVLDGSILPGRIDAPSILSSYAFTFEQVFTERYQVTVFPEPSADDAGFEDDTTSTTSQPAASTTTTTAPAAETTTTTTRIISIDATARVASEGVVVGDARECDLTLVLTSGQTERTYIAAGERAWLEDGGDLIEVSPTTEPAVSDLLFCPGWPVLLDEAGLAEIVAPGRGTPEDLDGIAAERFDLEMDDLAEIGLVPPGGAGVRLDEFTVWIVPEGPWLVGLDLTFRGTTEALEPALGPGFYPGANVSVAIDFRATRLGDPSLIVAVPTAAAD